MPPPAKNWPARQKTVREQSAFQNQASQVFRLIFQVGSDGRKSSSQTVKQIEAAKIKNGPDHLHRDSDEQTHHQHNQHERDQSIETIEHGSVWDAQRIK